ncbi:crooked neck-like protein 1 [Paramacrobiotus metropolitanus]|uniref:crooked neck-like protein 1 n=1 Tax=Paramacrobiotus metropolitanus TaxID=2943436 RepID=UPI002445689D|nr:crooked neck-like protein 1 [Paramacrobiotus metropolitanus]
MAEQNFAKGGKQKVPRAGQVKNKTPADIQITAEQLLREAKERQLEVVAPPPKQNITDPVELADFQLRKRKEFEDGIRRNRNNISTWIKYAQWEETQKEIQRCRSVFERALDVEHRNITLWLKFAEMEMRNRQINHARNIWDRAVTIMPRANQFWYKYTYMEEMLENVAGCRQVFERWMEWHPHEQAWLSFINFEMRYKELDRARAIYERFVLDHPDVKNWARFARFEEQNGFVNGARKVFERAVEFYGEDQVFEELYVAFARFEERQKEFERARTIYKYALDHLSKEKAADLFKNYSIFEKKHGSRIGIEDVVLNKRKFQYQEELKRDPTNYDAWFDLLKILEEEGNHDAVREGYERAISNVPPVEEKRYWRRYIYLWIRYAVFEELIADDIDRTRQVFTACVNLIPHKKFTFAKIWLLFAQFEIRQKRPADARKILGVAIGKCPKDKLFRGYVELEVQLREFDRCRLLYEKFLEFEPGNCSTWMRYAELEAVLGDVTRARAIYNLAVNQPRLDMPEVLWKSFVDFEIEQKAVDRARQLYERLLQRTNHVKVWISFAQFEAGIGDGDAVQKARAVYRRALRTLQNENADKEERVILLESWMAFEETYGDEKSKEEVRKEMPKRIKRRRKIQTDDGAEAGWEEYFDYIFPSDEVAQPNLKLLALARQWKKKTDASYQEEAERETGDNVPENDMDADSESSSSSGPD